MKKFAFVAASALAAVAPAHAAPVFFTDRSAFEAAAANLTFQDFEVARATAPVQDYGDFTLSESNGIPNDVFIDSDGATQGSRGANIVDNDASLFNLTFSRAYSAVGFDFIARLDTTVTITGSTVATVVLSDDVPRFFGVIDSAGLTSLTFDASGNPTYGIDALSYGDAAAVADAVPEPATWGLMLVGFGLVGVGLRSRRRSTIVTYA